MSSFNKEKIIVLLAIITIILALYVIFDSYGRLGEAYELCLQSRGYYFG